MAILSLAGKARVNEVNIEEMEGYFLTDVGLGKVKVLSVNQTYHEISVVGTEIEQSRGNYGEFYEDP